MSKKIIFLLLFLLLGFTSCKSIEQGNLNLYILEKEFEDEIFISNVVWKLRYSLSPDGKWLIVKNDHQINLKSIMADGLILQDQSGYQFNSTDLLSFSSMELWNPTSNAFLVSGANQYAPRATPLTQIVVGKIDNNTLTYFSYDPLPTNTNPISSWSQDGLSLAIFCFGDGIHILNQEAVLQNKITMPPIIMEEREDRYRVRQIVWGNENLFIIVTRQTTDERFYIAYKISLTNNAIDEFHFQEQALSMKILSVNPDDNLFLLRTTQVNEIENDTTIHIVSWEEKRVIKSLPIKMDTSDYHIAIQNQEFSMAIDTRYIDLFEWHSQEFRTLETNINHQSHLINWIPDEGGFLVLYENPDSVENFSLTLIHPSD